VLILCLSLLPRPRCVHATLAASGALHTGRILHLSLTLTHGRIRGTLGGNLLHGKRNLAAAGAVEENDVIPDAHKGGTESDLEHGICARHGAVAHEETHDAAVPKNLGGVRGEG